MMGQAISRAVNEATDFLGGAVAIGFFGFAAICMITHIVVCVSTNWAAMLILGLVFFPVGIIHGAGLLIGIW